MINKKRTGLIFLFTLVLLTGMSLLSAADIADIKEVEISCSPAQITAYQGEKVVITVEIKNNSLTSWRPEDNVFFSYHLHNEDGKLIAFDNRRFKIPRVLRRKKTTTFQVPVFFEYQKEGRYIVEFDIVKEGEFWGSVRKWQTYKAKLFLKSLFSDEFKIKYLPRFYDTGHPLLNKEQYVLRMTFKNCEIVKDGKLFGFAAGSAYPQVWIRDTATFMGYAKQFYPIDVLSRILEHFLEHQGEGGDIPDWVDTEGRTDKNTVETDQESSLVLAALEIAEADAKWLNKPVKNKRVMDRLEQALEWVWENRRDKDRNLLTSGFTADWGDVENTYPDDQRANKLSDRSTLVFSIYTQAKYIQAMDALIKMAKLQEASDEQLKKIQIWTSRRKTLETQTRELLYLKDKGYFITHIVPSDKAGKYFEMEKNMLAVGGNAEAIIAGLMNRGQVKRFLDVLEKQRQKYGLRTVSFTLIPPYPEGFFPHHLLRHPWSYQNGGEWDWIGGRVVKALFKTGFSQEAETYLLEIVKKNLANFSINEWEDRSGTGQGAHFYVGAAGVIGEALLMRGRAVGISND